MDETLNALSALLHQAAETHHQVFAITDGEDPDWASWYANHLLRLTHFPAMVDKPAVRSELVWKLVDLDKAYVVQKPSEAWERWYAERLLEHFS